MTIQVKEFEKPLIIPGKEVDEILLVINFFSKLQPPTPRDLQVGYGRKIPNSNFFVFVEDSSHEGSIGIIQERFGVYSRQIGVVDETEPLYVLYATQPELRDDEIIDNLVIQAIVSKV